MRKLIGHIDMDDVLIVASALSVPCHLWTSDKLILNELRKTNVLKTITTAELYNKIYKKRIDSGSYFAKFQFCQRYSNAFNDDYHHVKLF